MAYIYLYGTNQQIRLADISVKERLLKFSLLDVFMASHGAAEGGCFQGETRARMNSYLAAFCHSNSLAWVLRFYVVRKKITKVKKY